MTHFNRTGATADERMKGIKPGDTVQLDSGFWRVVAYGGRMRLYGMSEDEITALSIPQPPSKRLVAIGGNDGVTAFDGASLADLDAQYQGVRLS